MVEITTDQNQINEKTEIDLNNFEKITLHNKHEYVKVLNKKNNSIIMLDVTDINMPLIDYMKALQNDSYSYKTNDAVYNADGLIEQQEKSMIALKFESIENVNLNRIDDPEKRKIISTFINYKDCFNPKIKYINSYEGIAINENNRVIEMFFNEFTNQYETKYADTEVIRSEEKTATETFNGSFDGIDFEATLDYLEIDNKSLPLGNETITLKELEEYDNNENSLNNSHISEYKKAFIIRLLSVYRERKLVNNEKLQNDPPKVRILNINKNNPNNINRAAFISKNLIMFLSGFASALIIVLIIICLT